MVVEVEGGVVYLSPKLDIDLQAHEFRNYLVRTDFNDSPEFKTWYEIFFYA